MDGGGRRGREQGRVEWDAGFGARASAGGQALCCGIERRQHALPSTPAIRAAAPHTTVPRSPPAHLRLFAARGHQLLAEGGHGFGGGLGQRGQHAVHLGAAAGMQRGRRGGGLSARAAISAVSSSCRDASPVPPPRSLPHAPPALAASATTWRSQPAILPRARRTHPGSFSCCSRMSRMRAMMSAWCVAIVCWGRQGRAARVGAGEA